MKRLFTLLLSFYLITSIQAQTKVTFFTTEGRFVVEIYDNIVPTTGNNFLNLVSQKFYDEIIFHRVINNFMIQGGDPTGTGSGGSGTTIPDEFDSSLSNIQKTISMANSGPNTGTSQFFINLKDNTYLDFDKPPTSSKHPVFGIVTENFSVVQTIGAVATDANDRPIIPVVMDSIRYGDNIYASVSDHVAPVSNMRLIPNPVNDISESFLKVNAIKGGNSILKIYDAKGSQILQSNLILTKGVNNLYLADHIGNPLSSGLYFINLSIDKEILSQTLLIK